MTGMDPKQEILNGIEDPQTRGWLASYLDLYAHKLAEQQRRWADEENFILPVEVDGRDVPLIARQVAGILAALIDPKVQT